MATEQLNIPTSSMQLQSWLNGLTGAGIADGRIDGRRVLETYNPINGSQFNGALEGVFDQAFADRMGFGDLWKSGYKPGYNTYSDDGWVDATYSPELLDRLKQYQVAKLGFGDDMRQYAVMDPSGKVVSGTVPRAYNDTFRSEFLPAAAMLIGGAGLNSWLNSGALAGPGAGAGADLGLGGAFTAGEAGTAGLSGSLGGLSGGYGAGLGATEAGLGAAGLGGAESFSLAGAMDGLTVPGISTGGGLSGMSTAVAPSFEQMVASSGLTAANTAPGFLDKLKSTWSSLSPLQKVQLGSQLGGLLTGAVAGSGPNVSTNGQKGAGDLQMDIARQLQGLGTAELTNARSRQATFDPQFQQIIDAALASQNTNNQRSQQAWDEYTNTFLPAARRMAETAANFDTAGRRAEAGAEARAGVDAQMARTLAGMNRDLGRRGVSLSSGQSLARDMAARFAGAKASAAADTAARRDVENTGIALTRDVASLGLPTANLSLGASGQALTAGNTAAGTAATRQNTYNASLSPTFTALGNASGAAGGAGATYNGVANINLQKNAQDNAGLAGLGSLIGGLGAAFFPSDPKLKTVHGKVSGKKALRSLADAEVYDWTYRPGKGDGGRHIGRMAGEGDIDTPNGKAIDVVSEVGRHHAAIVEVAKDVARIKRRLSLADAVGR